MPACAASWFAFHDACKFEKRFLFLRRSRSCGSGATGFGSLIEGALDRQVRAEDSSRGCEWKSFSAR